MNAILDLCRSYRRRRFRKSLTPHNYARHLRACGARVGEDCVIESLSLDVGIEMYLVRIGDRVRIEREAAIMTHDGAAWVFRHEVPDLQVYGPVILEDGCTIGRGALLCPNVRIGANSVVSPGSMVIADVPPNTIVTGVPARRMGDVRKHENRLESGRVFVKSRSK